MRRRDSRFREFAARRFAAEAGASISGWQAVGGAIGLLAGVLIAKLALTGLHRLLKRTNLEKHRLTAES